MATMNTEEDAPGLLERLVGQRIETLTGRPNEILRIEGQDVIVATGRSPAGTAVPILWVQDALDRLRATGELRIDVPTVGHRSAFIGAVLRELPGTRALSGPQRIVLDGGASSTDPRAEELARRERMWAELIAGEGVEAAGRALLDDLRIGSLETMTSQVHNLS